MPQTFEGVVGTNAIGQRRSVATLIGGSQSVGLKTIAQTMDSKMSTLME